MKTDFDTFKQNIVGSEATEEAVETATGENVQRGESIDNIVDEEIREIIVDNIKESLRETFDKSNQPEKPERDFSGALKEGLKTAREPEVKQMLYELWYGTDHDTSLPELNQKQKEIKDNHEKRQMITEDTISDNTDGIDYEPDKDELFQVLEEFINFYAQEYPDKTADEIFVDIQVIYVMANNAAQQEPDTEASDMKELLDNNTDIFKNQIEQFIEQLDI